MTTEKLFTIGPVEPFESTLEVKARKIEYFRNKKFSDKYEALVFRLKNFAKASVSDRVIFLTCSGTGAMDAVASNVIEHNSKILVIVSGTFGERFSEICKIYSQSVDVLQLEPSDNLRLWVAEQK